MFFNIHLTILSCHFLITLRGSYKMVKAGSPSGAETPNFVLLFVAALIFPFLAAFSSEFEQLIKDQTEDSGGE